MKKGYCVLLISFLLSFVPYSSFGVEFDSSSAIITNRYFPMKSGDRFIYIGYGEYQGHSWYSDAVGNEVLDSVNCLKVINIQTRGYFYIYWIAQDISGNVWVLQLYYGETNITDYFGKENAVLAIPSNPTVGQIMTNRVILEINASVTKLSTGLGPFSNCLKIETRYEPPDVDTSYYAPDVGLVKEAHENNSQEEPRGWDLKEVIHDVKGDFDSNRRLDIGDVIGILQILTGVRVK